MNQELVEKVLGEKNLRRLDLREAEIFSANLSNVDLQS